MKTMTFFILMLALLVSFGCSNQKAQQGETDDLAIEEIVSESEETDDFVVEDALGSEKEAVAETVEQVKEEMPQEVAAAAPAMEMSGDVGEYTVIKGDTLLYVAFKIYGDYTKWRLVKNANPGLNSLIEEGQVLKYPKPETPFEWNPQGNPHLIRNGDTLGTISSDKYGTAKRWKDIWDNNRPMIKDPNLIFAGFTLYYIPDENRELASE